MRPALNLAARRAPRVYALPLAAALALPLASSARANILISIDKTTQHMSVVVDGAPRYIWPISTGRAGYDTPNGTFKPNRMDADHLSQEWDNAPMPNTIFFDMHGHAIHGFFDVKHLGMAVSHGCVRLSPDHAATLFALVKAEGMGNTTVIVAGRTPSGRGPAMARQPATVDETAASRPMPITPQYGQAADGPPTDGQTAYSRSYGQRLYARPQFPPQPQPYYGQPAYGQSYYGQPVYRQW